jgi:hypothetical protein
MATAANPRLDLESARRTCHRNEFFNSLLEPGSNPAARDYQRALFAQGIPLTAFAVDDIQAEYERLQKAGVIFSSEPLDVGTATIAVLDDTCGNLIQIYQVA